MLRDFASEPRPLGSGLARGNRVSRQILVSLLFLAAAIPTAYAQGDAGGKRVALIFGNDAYAISPLKNAVNDARAMDEALRASNFRTILVENAKKSDMESKIGEFLDMLGPDD